MQFQNLLSATKNHVFVDLDIFMADESCGAIIFSSKFTLLKNQIQIFILYENALDNFEIIFF